MLVAGRVADRERVGARVSVDADGTEELVQVAHAGVTRVDDRIVGAEMVEQALDDELSLRTLRPGEHAVGRSVGDGRAGVLGPARGEQCGDDDQRRERVTSARRER